MCTRRLKPYHEQTKYSLRELQPLVLALLWPKNITVWSTAAAAYLGVVGKRKVLPPSAEAYHPTVLDDEFLQLAYVLHEDAVQANLFRRTGW